MIAGALAVHQCKRNVDDQCDADPERQALNDHHAFLKDEKHKVFFIPGGQGGYVFDYSGDTLGLRKAVSDPGIERALYINDVMYLVSRSKISAWDENNWNKISELDITAFVGETPKTTGPVEVVPMMVQ